MRPDRGIVCTERRSDNLSTISDVPNNLSHQSDRVQMTTPGTPFLDLLQEGEMVETGTVG